MSKIDDCSLLGFEFHGDYLKDKKMEIIKDEPKTHLIGFYCYETIGIGLHNGIIYEPERKPAWKKFNPCEPIWPVEEDNSGLLALANMPDFDIISSKSVEEYMAEEEKIINDTLSLFAQSEQDSFRADRMFKENYNVPEFKIQSKERLPKPYTIKIVDPTQDPNFDRKCQMMLADKRSRLEGVSILVTNKAQIDMSKYPHVCPKCSAPAYIGFSKIECSRMECC